MQNLFNIKILAILSAILAAMSALAGLFEIYGLAIFFLLGSYAFIFISTWKATSNLASLSILFIIFSCMYAVSGPISVYWGQGLHDIFPKPYLLSETLALISISTMGMGMGIFATNPYKQSAQHFRNKSKIQQNQSHDDLQLYRAAIIFAIGASIFEFINIYRAGGIQIIFLGKAFYQSSISELTAYVPTNFLMMLSAAFSGLLFSNSPKQRIEKTIFIILSALPWISVMMVTGRRGAIAGSILVLVLALHYREPLKTIKIKTLTIALSLYLAMVGLYVARSQVEQVFISGNLSSLSERIQSKEVWLDALNPANNEFAAPFGNINTFLLKSNEPPKFGATYLNGFASAVPRILWKDKPNQEIYNFRDNYFSEEAARGSVASTGYSSILESYVNFRYFGVFFIYAIIIATLINLEKTKTSSDLFYCLFYLMLAPLTMSFHRSSLDASIAFPFALAMLGFAVINIASRIPRFKSIASILR